MYHTFYLICLIVEGDIFYLLDSLHSQTLLFGKLVIILNSYRKLPGRIAHSQVFPRFARFQEESQPVISPRRHVYVTMVRETMLDLLFRDHKYGTSGGGKWGRGPWEDCT